MDRREPRRRRERHADGEKMSHCDSTCSWCARQFFAWYRAQRAEGQASRKQRSGPGDRTAAAATSIRPNGARAGVPTSEAMP